MRTLKIFQPVYIRDTFAYISISRWNFDKLADREGNLRVIVYRGDQIAGQNIVNRYQWVKHAKFRERKFVYNPDEAMIYYYGIIPFEQPKTEDQRLQELYQTGVLS